MLQWMFTFCPEYLLLLFFLPPTCYACTGPGSVHSLASFTAAGSMHFLCVTFHCPCFFLYGVLQLMYHPAFCDVCEGTFQFCDSTDQSS